MANLMDYLDWRGDITLEQSPFNEIDALILTQFVYLPFEGIISMNFDDKMTIEAAGEEFLEVYKNGEDKNLTLLVNNCRTVMCKMMKTERFRNLKVFNYMDKFDPVASKQFAAVTIQISDDCVFVAYRGTDDTLTGWEEDFKLCYMTPVASQIEAEAYLKNVCLNWKGKIMTGGHSKGGNLSVYASMGLHDIDKSRILTIYNFDGPGFLPKIVNSDDYKIIVPKIKSYMPQGSVVGVIMYNESECNIVKSTAKGFLQHTVVSWQVLGTHFVNEAEFENSSIIFNKLTKKWVEEIEADKREQFIEQLFILLKSGESDTLTDITSEFPHVMNKIMRTYSDFDKSTKKMMRDMMGDMLKLTKNAMKEKYFDRKNNNVNNTNNSSDLNK